MSIKYVPIGNTKIVVNGDTYQNKDGKTAVLPEDKISKEELERLIKGKFIKKLELDESGAPINKDKSGKKRQPPKDKSKDGDSKGEESQGGAVQE